MEKKIEEMKPDKFIVVQTMGEDLEQISNALDSYELAENFKNSDYNKKNFPNAYILATLKPTPAPSLPTDEEINWDEVKDDISNILYNGNGTTAGLLNIMEYLKSRLRTNFSSEKCEGENEIAFGDWLLKNFDSGLYGWVRKKEAGKIYPACYNPPLSTIEVIEIFKNRNTNPPKQEQQTTK